MGEEVYHLTRDLICQGVGGGLLNGAHQFRREQEGVRGGIAGAGNWEVTVSEMYNIYEIL